jgi:hypothetical protein
MSNLNDLYMRKGRIISHIEMSQNELAYINREIEKILLEKRKSGLDNLSDSIEKIDAIEENPPKLRKVRNDKS